MLQPLTRRSIDKFYRTNDRIGASVILLIDEAGKNCGPTPISLALRRAKEVGLDLVEMSPDTKPPVCRIMDFGKFKYDQSKTDKKNSVKKEGGLKEIRLSAKIDDHDLNFKAKRAQEFIDKGYQVRVSMRLVGRENIFVERAINVFNQFALIGQLSLDSQPRKLGNRLEAMMIKTK